MKELSKHKLNEIAKSTVKDLHIHNTPLDNFIKQVLNRPVPETDVRINQMANNARYIPISFVETKLDEVFLGLWSIENFQTKVVANEIMGSIELKVFHPIAKVWLTRTGVAAVVIQQNSWMVDEFGAFVLDANKKKIKAPKPKPSDVDAKIINTLVKDAPHLKAECVKNAAKSFGLMFGRDLNRRDADFYESDIKAVINSARMPIASNGAFKSILDKINIEGIGVIAESREYFSFTYEQELQLAEIQSNARN